MKKILLIHTALQSAFVAITEGDKILELAENDNQKDHGAFLHEAIHLLMENNHIRIAEIDAIAVTSGPGSYTGIRVGLSAAKGLAYALQKPVVVCSTLKILAATGVRLLKEKASYIPMIHARKREYYAGFYDCSLKKLLPERLVDLNYGLPELPDKKIFFGPETDEYLLDDKDFHWIRVQKPDPEEMAIMAVNKLKLNETVSAEAVVPNYLKEAYTTQSPGKSPTF